MLIMASPDNGNKGKKGKKVMMKLDLVSSAEAGLSGEQPKQYGMSQSVISKLLGV